MQKASELTSYLSKIVEKLSENYYSMLQVWKLLSRLCNNIWLFLCATQTPEIARGFFYYVLIRHVNFLPPFFFLIFVSYCQFSYFLKLAYGGDFWCVLDKTGRFNGLSWRYRLAPFQLLIIKSRLNNLTEEENWSWIILSIGILRWRKYMELANGEILEVAKLKKLLFFLACVDAL